METIVIVGGGIAGLSCLNALLDKGISALLLESATIGTPKMCGEFLAPQAVEYLQKWHIGPIEPIQHATFFAKNQALNLTFSQAAGAIARSHAEHLLAQRARHLGGQIRENTPIKNIIPATKTTPHSFHLTSGEVIKAKSAIFATGKLLPVHPEEVRSTVSKNHLPYFGMKMHLEHIVSPRTLFMHSTQDAYLGIVPISNTTSNVACLIKHEQIKKAGSCKNFLYQLIEHNPTLKRIFDHVNITNTDWLESQAPEFQLKAIPNWPHAFWIGDAFASLHPAIGSGFAHGIHSAVMAAEYYTQHNPHAYHQHYTRLIKSKVWIGKFLHQLLLNPTLGSATIPLVRINPWISTWIQRKAGYS